MSTDDPGLLDALPDLHIAPATIVEDLSSERAER